MRRMISVAILLLVNCAGTAAYAQTGEPIYQVGDRIEIKVGGRYWRPCVVTDPGGQYAVARAQCEAFPTPGFTYPAIEDNFVASGTVDVRRAGAAARASTARPEPARAPAPAVAVASPAGPRQRLQRCTVGQRVLTPANRLATVVSAQGAGCTIHVDGDAPNVTDTWSAFMLAPANGVVPAAPVSHNLPLGEYACYGAGQRVLVGLGFKLLAGGRYTDLEGSTSGTYRVNGSNVSFIGGHLGGKTGRDIKDNGFTIGTLASCQKW